MVVPGRTFLSRMTRLRCTVKRLDHFREDLDLWEIFLAGMEWEILLFGRPAYLSPRLRNLHTCCKVSRLWGLFLGLLSLLGSFSFAARVVVPGRAFLSRMIHLRCTVKCLDNFREDLDLREKFLQGWNGKSFYLEDQLTSAPDFEIYTDAAGSVGYGGYS